MKLCTLIPGPLASLGERIILGLRSLESWLLLGLRLYMADIFWKSGLTKITRWENTVLLFRDEYKTPFLAPETAALLATTAELLCPVLLAIGLATRFAAIPLLIMTAVIQFTYLQMELHIFWAMVLGTIIVIGPGKIAFDTSAKAYYDGEKPKESWRSLTWLTVILLAGAVYWRDGETLLTALWK